jgi:hypothetical protein
MITGYSSQFDSLIHLGSLSLKVDIYQKQECKGHFIVLIWSRADGIRKEDNTSKQEI